MMGKIKTFVHDVWNYYTNKEGWCINEYVLSKQDYIM